MVVYVIAAISLLLLALHLGLGLLRLGLWLFTTKPGLITVGILVLAWTFLRPA